MNKDSFLTENCFNLNRYLKDFTDMTMIQAKIADVDDLQARTLGVVRRTLIIGKANYLHNDDEAIVPPLLG